MAKFILAVSLLMIYGCVNNQKQAVEPKVRKASFDYFELSYFNGSGVSLSFRVDSNRIFFLPTHWDSLKYGILPDSIFYSIDTTVYLLQNNTITKSINKFCHDCPSLALNVKTGQDTIKVFQDGRIDKRLWKVVKQLEFFADSVGHNYTSAFMRLETMEKLIPITKFRPPSAKKKRK